MNAERFSHSGGLFKLLPHVALLGGLCLAACQWLIFVYAPVEATMGVVQKIFYLHLPLAWWGLFSFFITFCASIAYLKTRSPRWDSLAAASAEVGLLLAALALVAGMFWAKPAWGLWWVWDARLTTTLIMCFVYAAYLLVRRMDMPPEKRSLTAAVIGIVAFLDVPLVYFSARLWSYVHPKSIGLEPEMKLVVIASVACFSLLWIALLGLRWRLAMDEARLEEMVRDRLLREDQASI